MMEELLSHSVSLSLELKLFAAVLGIFVIHLLFRVLERRLPRYFSQGDMRYRVRKFVVVFGYVIGILFMAVLFGDRLGRLSFTLGIAGAGVGWAATTVGIALPATRSRTSGSTKDCCFHSPVIVLRSLLRAPE